MIFSGVSGVVSGVLSTLTMQRVRNARTDARLTWLEDSQKASLRMLFALGRVLNAGAEVEAALVAALSTAPRVRQ